MPKLFNPDKPFVLPKDEATRLLTPLTPEEIEALNPFKPLRPESQPPESDPIPPEQIKEIFGGFLKQISPSWGETPEIRKPEDIIWSNATETDPAKAGEFTMNPDTIDINWEQIPQERIKVLPFSEFVGKPRWELAKYITTEWPDRDKYLIPGIEYYKYISEHPGQAPESLKDGNYHYFYGSILRSSGGRWSVPFVRWSRDSGSFGRGAGWLDDTWSANNRVGLLEK